MTGSAEPTPPAAGPAPLRLTQIVASLEARHGGPSRSVRGLSTAQAAAGHTVELLTTAVGAVGEAVAEGNLTVRTFAREWPAALAPSAPLRRHLRDSAPEIVHHHGLWLRPLHYAHEAARRTGVPLVISPRGMMSPWAWSHRRWKKALADHFIHPGALAGAAGWHATSAGEANDIRRLGFTQPVCLAPNGVAAVPEADNAAAAAHWQERWPELRRRPAALFHSRFHVMKRPLELIDLWAACAPRDWLLLLVGIPEQYSVPQLQAYVRRAGLQDRVAVFDGTDQLPPYAAATLFLLPSHTENFGLVVAEAMARSLPVLATETSPWQGLEAEGAGRCVPWYGFGAALTALLTEGPAVLQERGRRARAWALRDYSWKKSAGTLAAFYSELRTRR